MPSASRATYCRWVVNALKALGPSTPKSVYEWIRKNEPVPAADLSGQTADGENLFKKEVRFARWKMRQEGVIVSPKRGVWALS
ncbi:winged helix-turn-helix domain-containing protein [Rhizobium sp. FKY42]|uniref:winged helix-turn-helix domain-containing protein n=1 Tax=Rhizobium sp. FKY42 TaxID=2562310 RepID=UPI0010C00D42|nr:winged helix-turn-helix domain-containing protein [Rhizobium sp. FKY42]